MKRFLSCAALLATVAFAPSAFAQSDPVGESAGLKAPETGFEAVAPMRDAMPVALHSRGDAQGRAAHAAQRKSSDDRWTSDDNEG